MTAMAPAFAAGPPADPLNQGNTPEFTCEELEERLAASNASGVTKNKIRDLAGCPE